MSVREKEWELLGEFMSVCESYGCKSECKCKGEVSIGVRVRKERCKSKGKCERTMSDSVRVRDKRLRVLEE